MIILHYTAGVSAQSSPRYLARPDVKASAHLVIGRLGKIIQLVSFDVEAWACRAEQLCRTDLSQPFFDRYRTGQSGAFGMDGRTFCGGVREGGGAGAGVCGCLGRNGHLLASVYRATERGVAGGVRIAESPAIRFAMSAATRTSPAVNRTPVLNCTNSCASNLYVKL